MEQEIPFTLYDCFWRSTMKRRLEKVFDHINSHINSSGMPHNLTISLKLTSSRFNYCIKVSPAWSYVQWGHSHSSPTVSEYIKHWHLCSSYLPFAWTLWCLTSRGTSAVYKPQPCGQTQPTASLNAARGKTPSSGQQTRLIMYLIYKFM